MSNLINDPTLASTKSNTCSVEAQYPLLAMEKGLLFYALSNDNSYFYMSQGEYQLDNIDPQLFWKSWQHIIQHYEVLRSCYIENAAGVIEHVVHSHVASAMQMIHLGNLSNAEAENAYQKILQQEIQTPFDLTTPPLMRLVLCQMPQQKYRAIWTHHHLLFDLRSGFHVFDSVMHCYEAICHHQIINLKPTATKNEILAQLPYVETAQAKAYWQDRLKNYVSSDELPFMGLRNQVGHAKASLEYNFSIEKSLYSALKQFAHKNRSTPGLIIHTAWGLTLCSYLNRDDIVFGTVRSLPYALIKNAAGLFINNLPMRIHFDSETSVLDCLSDIREQHRQLKQYWNTALGDIQSWLELSFEQNLFNTCISFNLQETNSLIGKYFGDQFKQLQFKVRSQTHYALMLEFFGQENSLLGRFTAQPGLFSQQMLEHISNQLNTVLQQLISNPQQKICKLSWLSIKDNQRLHDWNKTAAPIPKYTLTSLIQKQIKRTPEQIAVHFQDKQLTYFELNAQANKLAYWLRQQGVKPNSTVGVYIERCLELPVALLGTIKSGGAYLPFDPKIPLVRLTEILIDSHTNILLTLKKFEKSLATVLVSTNIQIICVDQKKIFAACPEEDLDDINHPNDDIYVIYTSGSTGKPKGVRNHHSGVVNQLQWMQKAIPLHKDDRMLQKTTISFDVSVWDFFWPWLAGAQIVLAPPDAQYNFEQLTTIINQKKVTALQFIPTQLDSFIQESSAKTCQSIRLILSIGESLKQKTAKNCLTLWPSAILYNLYGPTETSIASTYYLCKKNDDYSCVPIGKPIDNTQLFILNHYQQLVPIGGAGELYIGGVGVAKGYLNKSELTAKYFIENPLSSANTNISKTLYKTGDLVAWSPAGELHYIGRIDNQIKRYGARVELSEIENRLLQQSSIKQCVVVLQKDQDHEYLVAYCVATNLPERTVDLYKKLAEYLPNYMIPTDFVWLESLPLLANGKLDRAALPQVNSQKIPEKISTSINNSISEKLQIIWQEVLRLESVGIYDNLFTIGGDSISVIQIVNKARAIGIDIRPKWIFSQPTISSLSELISTQQEFDINNLIDEKPIIKPPIKSIDKIIPLEKKYYDALDVSATVKSYGITDIYPLSPLQQGILFHSVSTKTQDPYVCQYSFNLTGDLNLNQFRQTWQKLMCHYDMLRTGFSVDKKGEYSQFVLRNCPLPLDIIDLSAEPYAKARRRWARIVQKDRCKNFSFANPPLFRIILSVLDNNQYACLLSMHHIIHDAWSIILLFKMLQELYNQRINILDTQAHENSGHYKDFIMQQLKKDQEAGVYWKKLLHGFESVLQLDINSLPAANIAPKYSCCKLSLDDSLCKNLNDFAKAHQTTINIVMQSAWTILLNRYAHQEDIVYGTVLSGRAVNLPNIEQRFGLFLQTIPVRVRFTESLTVLQLIQQLNQQFSISADYAHYSLSDIQSDHFDGEKKPLFDYLIIFENYPSTINMQDGLANLTIDEIKIHALTHYPISLLVMTEPRIQLSLFYDEKKFTHASVKNFLIHFKNLLEEMIKSSKQLTNKLSILPKKQLQDLILFSEGEKNNLYKNLNIYGLFCQHALNTPEKTALVFQNTQLTYQKINDAVLNFSRSLTVQSGEVVGLYFSQHPYLFISILSLLNMGCTYLPIDPKASQKYIENICSENSINVILTNNELSQQISRLVKKQNIKIIVVDQILEDNNDIPLILPTIKNDIAYIMYTSGSTGKPKGVAISHSAIINLLLSLNHHIQFGAEDCFLGTTAYTFDISIIEWLLPFITGGTCILLSPEQLADDQLLNKLSNGYSRMFIQTTPSVWYSVLTKPDWIINRPLTILAGGEALSYELAKKLLKKTPEVWNCYGPTETTIWSTIYKVNELSENIPRNIVPIGKPLFNTTAWVLDEQLNPAPIGITGELYLGGAGLMQTYVGEHADFLNKEKLIPNPFKKNELFYKTGDKTCWLPDGNLQFLERFDEQVKIRGFRVDLNQITSILETHPWVKKAITLKQDKKTHDAALITYLLLEDQNILFNNAQIAQTHCNQWGVIYDRLYQQSVYHSTFDTTGWTSSYTGKSLAETDMQEWFEHTADRIIALAPQKILEIGCGMGLLLFHIAPLSQTYHGIDISSAALTHITEHLADKPFKDKVVLSQGNANTFYVSPDALYDTIIINSVIQYFPHIYYLVDVLDRCLNLLSTGGQIFIGDVRSFMHLKQFHADVTLHRASPTTSLEELKHRYFKYLHREKELVIDPLFFIEYAQLHARISHVDIQLKTGQCENEMNDYRYDVVLHLEKPITETVKMKRVDWQKEQLASTELAQYLQQQAPMIYLANIPNARWIKANKLISCFDSQLENLTLAKYTALLDLTERYAISPFDLKSSATANYEVFCLFSAQKNPAYFDAVLRLKSLHAHSYLGQSIQQRNTIAVNWQSYANKPWQVSCYKKIHDNLYQYLLDKLPHYMVPPAFIVIDDIPVTPNGKLNSKALTHYEPIVTAEYQTANTDIEKAVINIWQDILGVHEIGVKDNFFQLGGHSLNALQVIHAVTERWHISLDVIRLFETPTVFELAQEIQKMLLQVDSEKENLSSSLVMLSKTGKKPPLFLIHPVGGTVFCYIPLTEALSIDHPIIGIQDPGITTPDMLFNNLIEMATYYIQLIKTKQPTGPYYLAGASLGGTLAAEMAYQLTEQGDTVNFVGLFDTWAAFTEAFNSRARLEKTLWRQYHFLKERLAQHDIANPEPWLDLNYQRLQLLLQYQHPKMKQPMCLFKAQDIEPEYQDLNEASNHWSLYTTQPLKIYSVPGNHESILVEPNVKVLAKLLMECLEKVDSL